MNKKYLYYAPSDIGITDPQWQFLKLIDRKVVKIVENTNENYCLVSQFNYDYPVFKVFKEDLQEIKDDYINSPDEYLKSKYPDNYSGQYIKSSGYFESDMWLAFREGEKNDRKLTNPVLEAVSKIIPGRNDYHDRVSDTIEALQQLKEQDK
jgi:hypothetical protein